MCPGRSGSFDVTSISAYKDYHFDAVNDEGTPFDVYRNAGGFWNDYKQMSQELRLSSTLGDCDRLADRPLLPEGRQHRGVPPRVGQRRGRLVRHRRPVQYASIATPRVAI